MSLHGTFTKLGKQVCAVAGIASEVKIASEAQAIFFMTFLPEHSRLVAI
jgi:hypothetical protein